MTEPTVGEETVDADDLLDDPRTDIEALCLGALLWSPAPAAQRVTDMLDPIDFDRPVYAELFTVITGQVTAGVPHDPASIAAALTRAGTSAGHHGAQLRHALTQATLSGAPAETVEHYARTVISAAYRRSYHVAAASPGPSGRRASRRPTVRAPAEHRPRATRSKPLTGRSPPVDDVALTARPDYLGRCRAQR